MKKVLLCLIVFLILTNSVVAACPNNFFQWLQCRFARCCCGVCKEDTKPTVIEPPCNECVEIPEFSTVAFLFLLIVIGWYIRKKRHPHPMISTGTYKK